jgi:signal transduction histidine kinase
MTRQDDAAGKKVRTTRRKAFKTAGKTKVARVSKHASAGETIALLQHQLNDAQERQTATSEVLNVISSSPRDMNPVFEAILSNALRICEAKFGHLLLYEGEKFLAAHLHDVPPSYREYWEQHGPISPSPNTGLGRLARTKQVAHIPDLKADSAYVEREPLRVVTVEQAGARSFLAVPMLKENRLIGAIVIYRKEVRPFSDKQIELVRNFAAQAVIAIENARLFSEVQARTRDLEEALRYQTGSANILSVIASSPTDVGPVLHAIVESACELCQAYDAVIILKHGDELQLSAHHGPIPINRQNWGNNRTSVSGRAMADGRPVHVHDVLADEAREFEIARGMSRVDGCRTLLAAPLLREGEPIGALLLRRTEVNPFSDKQIALLQTFANQAVIAIGNVRLFEQVQSRTRELSESLQQQTATSEVLQVISSSPGELAPVFEKMLENATRVCGAGFGSMVLVDGDKLQQVAFYNPPPELAAVRTNQVRKVHPLSSIAAAVRDKRVVQIEDIRSSPAYLAGAQHAIELTELGGARTIVVVPMVRDDDAIGVITVYRQEVRPFGDKQIDLLTNFARQAVIAIENARLLRELRLRTEEVSRSLDDLRTAQDRLVQTEKLASLGQLTAGIAHEIKNPLNFVNNFASISAELVDEMTDVFQNSALDEASRRKELDEIRELLKGNLEKVVQHGKRADSIVKNMLQHSRGGSGEQRSADINALVEESLNLAYHGARAETPGFNITIRRDLDPAAGMVDIYPQEITRVFLNLISNGFYAAIKRKEAHEDGFEPTLTATTKRSADHVEIRIRDNGTGIPDEIKDKIFNPFFTTKPAGKGTGLGLSLSHDIIVKQHAGSIRIETELGVFTEFIITLPRATSAQNPERSAK